MSEDGKMSKADLEWENRVLCSDEACIGTIGPDGLCRECGKPYEGKLPETFGSVPADDGSEDTRADGDEEAHEPIEEDDPDSEVEQETASDDADDEWAQRKLCSDEACIGTIGPDGLCKECGKPYTG